MAKSATDMYTTTVILTAKCGTKISAALFKKKISDAGYSSVKQYLEDNESKILNTPVGKQQKNKFFPKSYKSINMQEWDLQIYCFLLLEICCLTNTEYKGIEYLRKKRNKLSHRSDPSLTSEQYEKYAERIRSIIKELLEIIKDEQLKQEVMQDMETALRNGTSEFQDEFVKILHNWYSDIHTRIDQLETNIENRVDGVDDRVKGFTNGQKSMMEKVENLVSLYKSQSETPLKIPGTEIEILVKNCNSEKEKTICKVLADLFKERISNESSIKADLAGLSEETIENLRIVVGDVFQELVSKGIKVVDAFQRCLILEVDCTSLQVLKDLVNDCAEGRMTVCFRQIENVVKGVPGYENCLLQAVMTEDEFWKCISKLVSEVEERSVLIKRNTNEKAGETTSVKHNDVASVRIQLSGESLPATSNNDLLRSEVKQMETTIQREFDSHNIYLERKVHIIGAGADEQFERQTIHSSSREKSNKQYKTATTSALTNVHILEGGDSSVQTNNSGTPDSGTPDSATAEIRNRTRGAASKKAFKYRPVHGSRQLSKFGDTVEGRNSCLWVIILLCSCMIMTLTVFYSPKAEADEHITETQPQAEHSLQSHVNHFHLHLEQISAKYPSQSSNFWKTVNSSIRRLLTEEEDTYPAVLLFAIPQYASATGTCISKAIIQSLNKIYSSTYTEDGYIYSGSLDSETPGKMKRDLDTKLKEKLNKSKGVFLDHIENFPAEVALLLSSYCDRENAPYKSAALILGLHIDFKKLLGRTSVGFLYLNIIQIFNRMQAYNGMSTYDPELYDYIKYILDVLWGREVGVHVIRALMSKIANSVAIVEFEPLLNIECE